MGIRTKLFDKGRLVEEQMIRFLIKLDERVSNLENGTDNSSDLEDRVSALESQVEALQNSETPSEP